MLTDMTTTRDGDIDLESGDYVPVDHILKFYLAFGVDGIFEKFELAISCSSLLQQLKRKSQKIRKTSS